MRPTQLIKNMRVGGQSQPQGRMIMVAADELERQADLIDFLQSEREHGVAETFCGVPMREAMQIVLAAKEQSDV